MEGLMVDVAVPEAARERLAYLYAAYILRRRDLAVFAEGVLQGMGLSPDDWDLDTARMVFHPQRPQAGDFRGRPEPHGSNGGKGVAYADEN